MNGACLLLERTAQCDRATYTYHTSFQENYCRMFLLHCDLVYNRKKALMQNCNGQFCLTGPKSTIVYCTNVLSMALVPDRARPPHEDSSTINGAEFGDPFSLQCTWLSLVYVILNGGPQSIS